MGLLFGLAAIAMRLVFWGFIALVWYVESFWMAAAVALPFVLFYKLFGRFADFEEQEPEDYDPHGRGKCHQAQERDWYDDTLNAFQQPLSDKPQRRKLPG